MKIQPYILTALLIFLCFPMAARAADAADATRVAELKSLANRLKYQEGQIELPNGLATIRLTEGFRYLDPAGTETVLTGIWGNPSAGRRTLGMIVPAGFNPFGRDSWCVVVQFEEDGYVKDSDADSLNYTKLLKQMKESTREASAERVKNGYSPIELVGWATPPRYDKQTHKFYWAKELKFGDSEENTLNYNLRILGRRGILVLNVVSSMTQFPEVEKSTPEILAMVDFNSGHQYADYTPGTDKLATYGLAALVVGGIAAKTGLLKGIFLGLLAMKKFLIIGVIAVLALLKKLLGGRSAAQD
jgi:uncharacterized membrane-anchored protein